MPESLYDIGDPLTVLVTDGRYDIIDISTPRNIMLAQILQGMGGVADTVPPGTYHFNVKSVDGEWRASLELAPQ